MKAKTLKTWLAGASAALLLAACGGGGSADGGIGGTGGGGDGGGGGSTGVSYGTITGFGSVWVNGVEFSTSGTTIKTDDNPSAGQDDLRIGMVVRVDGSISNATAATITVDDAVKGRVESVRPDGSYVVMGQVVQIDADTRFDNNVRPVQGDLVHVHGLVAGDGVIAAGYIEKKTTPSTPPFAVKGLVKLHDTAAQTFVVGTLTVRYAGADVSDMPAGLWNGREIDAKGSTCAGTSACGTLTASKVEPSGANVQTASQAEIEGIVTTLATNTFTIGNQTVNTTPSTVYEGGVAADLLVGTKVEAEGSISNGLLTATKVSIRDGVRIEADVESVNAAAGTFTLAGLPGVTVSTSAATRLDKLLGVGNLAAGNHVRLRGRPGANNGVVATRLELRSTGSDSRVELRAIVQSVSAPTSITMQGVAIDLSNVSNDSFQDVSGNVIGRTAFFTQVQAGTLVKVRGDLAGSSVSWSEAEIEND